MESDDIILSHKENKVPATSRARVLQLANLGFSIAGGTITEAVKQTLVMFRLLKNRDISL